MMILHNGRSIPKIGVGMFLVSQEIASEIIYKSVEQGYRLIDTADVYLNEIEIGMGIKKVLEKKLVTREELFISSKLNAKIIDSSLVITEYNKSLKKLNVNYLDTYLIHWVPRKFDTLMKLWYEFEELYLSGKVKSIGICNITLYYLDKLIKNCRVKPHIIQVEYHPFLQQNTFKEYCDNHNIKLIGYGQFAKGLVFKNETLKQLSTKYNAEISDIVISWAYKNGIIILPKTNNPLRLISNYNAINLELTEEDLKVISKLNDGLRVYRDPENNPFTIIE